MFKLMDNSGEVIATEPTPEKAYQRANDECVGLGKDVLVWYNDRVDAVFAYGAPPTIIIKPHGKYSLVMVTK